MILSPGFRLFHFCNLFLNLLVLEVTLQLVIAEIAYFRQLIISIHF